MVTLTRLRTLNRDKLRKMIWSRRRRLDRWWQLHNRYQGLPSGLSFETVNQLCIDHFGEPLKNVSYVHLSGWKVSGAYRLFLESVAGRTWQLVYKNAIYNLKELPALSDLSIRPGIQEYLVYKQANSALDQYLPIVYVCREIVPGRHYQYILEDMNQDYQMLKIHGGEEAVRKNNLLKAIDELLKLHQALREWFYDVDSNYLLSFDHKFSVALLVYAQQSLESYFQVTRDPIVSEINKRWPIISKLYSDNKFHDQIRICPIHGDYHSGHIYIHKNNPMRIKLIDWEWLGLGVPHFDLATLLQDQDPDHEQFSLAHYATLDKRLSFDEHRRLYNWCQIERGLLSASYLAVQHLRSSRKAFWVPEFIKKSTMRALRAQEQLI